MTCVIGLWDLEDTYDKSLENTLRINCPYVFLVIKNQYNM